MFIKIIQYHKLNDGYQYLICLNTNKYVKNRVYCALKNGRQRGLQCDNRVFQEKMDQLGNPLLHQPYQLHGPVHCLSSLDGKRAF